MDSTFLKIAFNKPQVQLTSYSADKNSEVANIALPKTDIFDKFTNQSEVIVNMNKPSSGPSQNVKYLSKRKKIILFSASSLILIGGIITLVPNIRKSKNLDFSYIKDIAIDMGNSIGEKIAPEKLKCIMGQNELLSILPKMKNKNYVSSFENINAGIFKIDLHSHSNYSDGVGNVEDLLNQAAEYGNKLFSKTGEKFIFALSDHDEIEGVKKALQLIVKNPDKYKNVRFVPSVELSFVHKSQKSGNQTEGSELLAHCINPFSKNLNNFIKNLHQKRMNMIERSLIELSSEIDDTKFLMEEMRGYYLKIPNENFAYNLHWRIFNYAQIKRRISKIAAEQNKNPEVLYKELMQKFMINKNNKSPENFDKMLKTNDIHTNTPSFDSKVDEICKRCFPEILENRIVASGENSFEDIIEMAEKEKDLCLGFAHPYFFTRNFYDPKPVIEDYIKKSKGYLKTTERYHQSYPNWLKKEDIEAVNEMLDKENLLFFGGRDNHSPIFINI